MAEAIAQSLQDPALRGKIIDQGAAPQATTPDDYRKLMESNRGNGAKSYAAAAWGVQ